jgi:acyl carrier protein
LRIDMRARRSTARRGPNIAHAARGRHAAPGQAPQLAASREWWAPAGGAIMLRVTHREPVRRTVLRILGDVAPDAAVEGLRPDVAFRDQIEIDSLDFLNFVLALEKRLRVRIPEADYPKLATLDGCLAYLDARRRPAARR